MVVLVVLVVVLLTTEPRHNQGLYGPLQNVLMAVDYIVARLQGQPERGPADRCYYFPLLAYGHYLQEGKLRVQHVFGEIVLHVHIKHTRCEALVRWNSETTDTQRGER